MKARLIFPVCAALSLGACATLPPPSMTVETSSRGQLISGADCVVSTPRGSWHVTTPGSAPVGQAAAGYLRVMCSKAGFRDTELQAAPIPSYSPGYANSAYFGMSGYGGGWRHGGMGLGMGFGAPLYDPRPDRWDYPEHVMVEMAPNGSPDPRASGQ